MEIPFRITLSLLLVSLALWSWPGQSQDNLAPDIEEHLKENPDLPSMSVVVVADGKVVGMGAAGVRKKGDDTPVTIHDKYHIGSCSKAFTATLAAKLVEKQEIGWDTTVGEVLRSLKPNEGFEKTTLKQLVSNTGGFPEEVPTAIWVKAWGAKGDEKDQREEFAEAMLALEPWYEPGTQNKYSNTGFSIAGVMMEKVMRKSWEDLIEREIFVPLGMKSGGFYAPAEDERKPDQPWGHDGTGTPVPPGPGSDNPAAIAPAGAIHCSMPDLMKWVMMHMNSETGPVIEKAETFELLHTPVIGDYAMGWIVTERGWANGKALTHVGSNTMYTTVIWIAPERKFAIVVSTNTGQGVGFLPCDAFVGKMMGKYLE